MPVPGPFKIASDVISGSAVVNVIEPDNPVRSMVSEPSLLPAAHSPATPPDAKLLFAAVMASRRVHKPSLVLATSAVLLTVIVVPAALVVTNVYTRKIVQIRVKMSARLWGRRRLIDCIFRLIRE